MRSDTTELGDARRRVEALVCDLPGGGVDERMFSEPWELRAFAMAVAAYHNGKYEWSEFQLSLIQAIKQWEGGGAGEPWSYYEHWLTALESVLADNGVLSDADVDHGIGAIFQSVAALLSTVDLPPGIDAEVASAVFVAVLGRMSEPTGAIASDSDEGAAGLTVTLLRRALVRS